MPAQIKITANGRHYILPAGQALTDFLKSQGLAPGRVVVERNGLALSPTEMAGVTLENGDILEIVRIVAG
ncbi:MAG: thiamine biosynthesis protein ThiS, partial [Verrucomicrobia bacterium RIFCSPLOWO2_12_FULL_64_8]